ncbi:MAG: CHAD domain-containing protein [Patulibacter sp.]|nr:CHAD domain-containing protein [Patulibacter sp.]
MAKALPIPGLAADMPFAAAAVATVRVRAEELFAHAEGVLDVEQIERVHDMRVASRRLRAALEVYAPCFAKAEHRRVLRDVKALADALGARRDPDVQLEGLERFAAALPDADRRGVLRFMATARGDQERGNERLATALRELDLDELAARIAEMILTVEVPTVDAPSPGGPR